MTALLQGKSWAQARLLSRSLLTKEGSTKQTFHIVLEVPGEHAFYLPGDSIGLVPRNSPELVEQICAHLPFSPNEEVLLQKTQERLCFRRFLREKANLQKITRSLFRAFSQEEGCFAGDLLALVRRWPPPLSTQELANLLLPIAPRFYSIASSPSLHPQEVHLTVSLVHQMIEGEKRYGTASSFLCKEMQIGDTFPFFVHSSPHFRLPSTDHSPLLMIGPGTGIAPFRAFLQERIARGAKGKNWLFFGERNRACDFYYEEEWLSCLYQGRLRLDAAFSRDQDPKVYVQDLLQTHAKEVYAWIDEGAHLYICGDAKKMAKDVTAILKKILQEGSRCTKQEGEQRWRTLRKEGRVQLDIY